MAAQAEVAASLAADEAAAVPDSWINRHFAWLVIAQEEGENRHLFDASAGTFPIRNQALRYRSSIPADVLALLEARAPLPRPTTGEKGTNAFVRAAPTRISRLIRDSIATETETERRVHDDEDDDDQNGSRPASALVSIRSPLSVVLAYLTVPSMPGSEAYALLAVRNLLFELFSTFPADVGLGDRPNSFKVADVEAALSHIWTSLRTRHHSRGRDPIPPEGRAAVGGMLRHFFAALEILWLQFDSAADCVRYLLEGNLRPERPLFEFVRSSHLDHLPELGEVVNQLWGLPIPIRGSDTLFRGGLRFSSRQGLVVGIHGGPGTGKTSLALAIGATLAPFGIDTLFITAEETKEDLLAKAEGLVPDELRRLSFFPKTDEWIDFQHLPLVMSRGNADDPLEVLTEALAQLSQALAPDPDEPIDPNTAAKPCRAIVVLDGIHDLLMTSSLAKREGGGESLLHQLREFIHGCRELRALVILTAGEDWAGERALDYLVDVVLRLSHEGVAETGRKPDRRITISKARHQLCAVGTHGLQISGAKGVRFSPQINYRLDHKALWLTRVPDKSVHKKVLKLVMGQDDFKVLARRPSRYRGKGFHESDAGVFLFKGSNIFLNGEGSGGKAALAIKLALSPSFSAGTLLESPERILVVSFLYPEQYYQDIKSALLRLRALEYGINRFAFAPSLKVIHLYPGNYRSDQLFNRIEWELEAADLSGNPYTAVVIDGLHNVSLQFPEIENYPLFWPQLYASLRSRPVTIISTHTTFSQQVGQRDHQALEHRGAQPLRHFLVQNTDFRFEIDPATTNASGRYVRADVWAASNIFWVRTTAAINQRIPKRDLLWSRDQLVLFDTDQGELPLEGSAGGRSAPR